MRKVTPPPSAVQPVGEYYANLAVYRLAEAIEHVGALKSFE